MDPAMDNSGGRATRGRAAPLAPAELDVLIPGYHFTDFIDSGGMGAVYKAVQKSLDRVVAVKLLSGGNGGSENFAERFKREAEALARLNHPNIIAVYDFGETGDGQMYYVMEFVPGMDLHQLLRQDPPEPRKMVQIIAQVCEALEYAHGHGIVHRDIKPANILIDEGGRVKVADFGLAKVVGSQTISHAGPEVTMGTPDYVAPEVMDHGGKIDHRADIYSLGVMIYEMFTGYPPKGRWEPPSVRSGADKRVDALVSRAMQNDPEKRYQSVHDMTQVLNKLLSNCDWRHYHRPGRSVPVEPGGAITVRAGKRGRPGRWLRRTAVLMLVAGACLAVGWMLGGRPVMVAGTPSAALEVAAPASAAAVEPGQMELAAWVVGHGGAFNVLTPENMWEVEGPEVPVAWPPALVPVSRAGSLLAVNPELRDLSELPQGRFLVWRVSFREAPLAEDTFAELVGLIRSAGTVSHLNLRGLEARAEALRHLAGLPSLRSLDVSGSRAVTPEAVPLLGACKQLRLLRVGGGGTQVNETLLAELRLLLPGCGVHEDP